MSGSYSLSRRQARVCRIAGPTLILVATLWAVVAAAGAIVPGWTFSCGDGQGCRQASTLVALLPERERASILHDPAALARFTAYGTRPAVRAGLAALVVIREGLLILLFVAVGLALRGLGRRGERVLSSALPWLRRGAFAGLLWAVAQPLSESGRAMLLFPGTPGGAAWYVGVDLTVAGPALLLAIAAYAVAWALEAGSRAERDLADFV